MPATVLSVLAGILLGVASGGLSLSGQGAAWGEGHPVLEQGAWALQGLGIAAHAVLLFGGAAATWRRTALLGLLFGLSWHLAGVWWLWIGLHHHAGLSSGLSMLAVLALCTYLALFTVGADLITRASWRRLGTRLSDRSPWRPWAGALLFAAGWVLAELGRAALLTGFPWAASGHVHLDGPFRPWMPWLGVHGCAGLAAFMAAALGWLTVFRTDLPRRAGCGIALLAGVLGAGMAMPDPSFTRDVGPLTVSLLQGNIGQPTKFDRRWAAATMDWHLTRLLASQADLTLAAETAFPVLEKDLPARAWQALRDSSSAGGGVRMFGIPEGLADGRLYNTLLALGPAEMMPRAQYGDPFRYRKRHLVPFAEFSPPAFRWFTDRLTMPLPDFVSDPEPLRSLHIRTRAGIDHAIAPLICFEDLFSQEVAQRFALAGEAPTVFANASNLAWFEDSPALAQQLRVARLRSLEFQRPTVRSANTGPTVAIDHLGRVTHALRPLEAGVLEAVVTGRAGLTPYAWWASRFGLWPLLVVSVALLAWPCTRMPAGRRTVAA